MLIRTIHTNAVEASDNAMLTDFLFDPSVLFSDLDLAVELNDLTEKRDFSLYRIEDFRLFSLSIKLILVWIMLAPTSPSWLTVSKFSTNCLFRLLLRS